MDRTRTKEVPETAAIVVGVVNVIELDSSEGVRKVKLLIQLNVLTNILGILDVHVQTATINLISNSNSKMFKLVCPRKRISTEINTWDISRFLQKCKGFCLTFQ